MTLAEALDAVIARRLRDLEARIRRDLALTAVDVDDVPPVDDPASPWARVTVDEILAQETATLRAWKDRILAEPPMLDDSPGTVVH